MFLKQNTQINFDNYTENVLVFSLFVNFLYEKTSPDCARLTDIILFYHHLNLRITI